MKLSEIRVVDDDRKRKVFVDGVEQKNVAKVETEVLPGETTVVKISYFTDRFELIRERS